MSTILRFTTCSPAELARAARDGDSDAAGELYRRVRRRARRAARAFCSEADADDAVAEGMTKSLLRLGQLRDPSTVEAWMLRCVVRAAIDLSRRNGRLRPSDAAQAMADRAQHRQVVGPDEAALAGLERQGMAEAVDALAPDVRLLLYLRYGAGLSVQHVALVLHKPVGTIRRQCVEARREAAQGYLCRQLRPAWGDCAPVVAALCREPYRPPTTRMRRRTSEHLRRCGTCRERQRELSAVLRDLGCPRRP